MIKVVKKRCTLPNLLFMHISHSCPRSRTTLEKMKWKCHPALSNLFFPLYKSLFSLPSNVFLAVWGMLLQSKSSQATAENCNERDPVGKRTERKGGRAVVVKTEKCQCLQGVNPRKLWYDVKPRSIFFLQVVAIFENMCRQPNILQMVSVWQDCYCVTTPSERAFLSPFR